MTGYKYASVVRLTMDDPCNEHLDEGDVIIVAGKHDDEYRYSVLDDEIEGFTDVVCEVLGTLEADYCMSESGIKDWAADRDYAAALAEGSA